MGKDRAKLHRQPAEERHQGSILRELQRERKPSAICLMDGCERLLCVERATDVAGGAAYRKKNARSVAASFTGGASGARGRQRSSPGRLRGHDHDLAISLVMPTVLQRFGTVLNACLEFIAARPDLPAPPARLPLNPGSVGVRVNHSRRERWPDGGSRGKLEWACFTQRQAEKKDVSNPPLLRRFWQVLWWIGGGEKGRMAPVPARHEVTQTAPCHYPATPRSPEYLNASTVHSWTFTPEPGSGPY